ncbi:UNVERIFIED_CONTAM: long-subunit acyl-CoA synthetase (AMP-forming) [Acetivibrio alkalicellulosi]
MTSNRIDTFYKLFQKIKNSKTNYLYCYITDNLQIKPSQKSFYEIFCDIELAYSNLIYNGITKNDVVGLYLDNSYHFFVIDMALILLGAQTIIQSSLEPVDLVQKRLEQFKVTILIVKDKETKDFSGDFKKYEISNLFDSNIEKVQVKEEKIHNKDFSIIFSSGTSGIPKSLGISEKGSLESGSIYFQHMKYNQNDRMLIYLPLASYQQRFLMWSCLANNVNIVLVDEKKLFKGLVEFKPSIILAPPNFYYNLFRLSEGTNFFTKILRRVLPYKANSKLLQLIANNITYKKLYLVFGHRPRYLLTGMAPIDIKLLEYFQRAYLDIYQIYGQTEIGMICGNTKERNKIGTVGTPILKIDISDEGEIIANNDNPTVNRYYLEDGSTEDLHPFSRSTGDVGDIDNEGFITISGRKNETIILSNGVKINPSVLENKIKTSFSLDEVLIFKSNDKKSMNMLDIVIFFYAEKDNLKQIDDIKGLVINIPEIKYNSENIRISKFAVSELEKKHVYTENGKFSRVRAINLIKENSNRIDNIL